MNRKQLVTSMAGKDSLFGRKSLALVPKPGPVLSLHDSKSLALLKAHLGLKARFKV